MNKDVTRGDREVVCTSVCIWGRGGGGREREREEVEEGGVSTTTATKPILSSVLACCI